ncbi:MAG TPA: hypothetical protein VKX17_11040 [Planctomycetota bacterium]|nr:hypothetical protein [Planctomycetota bacterium]
MRFLRFHLSTALIVMIAAGALVGTNVLPNVRVPRTVADSGSQLIIGSTSLDFPRLLYDSKDVTEYHEQIYSKCQRDCTTSTDHYGWPFVAATKVLLVDVYGPPRNANEWEVYLFEDEFAKLRESNKREISWSFSTTKIIGNILVAVALLFFLTLLCEFLPEWLKLMLPLNRRL